MSFDQVRRNLLEYKGSFYRKRLIKGLLLTLGIFLLILFASHLLETFFWFSSTVRLILLILLVTSLLAPFYLFIIVPILELLRIRKGLNEEYLALKIGSHFPDISDKLVNIIQLDKSRGHQNSLLDAAIDQKSAGISGYDFRSAVKIGDLNKYALLLGCFIFILSIVAFFNRSFVLGASSRIVNFQQTFERPAPFQFHVKNESLSAFKNEDLQLAIEILGSSLPGEVYLHTDTRTIPLKGKEKLEYLFEHVQESFSFHLSASGFKSKTYYVSVNSRPEINSLSLKFQFPKHTRLPDEEILNSGNAMVPEGTVVQWKIEAKQTDSIAFISNNYKMNFKRENEDSFRAEKTFLIDENYELQLANSFGRNKSRIAYTISVLKDAAPRIEAIYYPDSIYYKSVLISGSIVDDYGFNQMNVFYKTKSSEGTIPLFVKEFPQNQAFLYEFMIDSLFKNSPSVELWVEVRDNDPINGFKRQSSEHFFFSKPDKKELEKMMDENARSAEKSMQKSQQQSEEINARLKQLEERLKNQSKADWQEEKLINELLEDKQAMQKDLEELQKEFEQLKEFQKEFLNLDEKLNEKAEALQKMIDQMMDEETMKLFEELQKLMAEKAESQKLMEKIAQIKPKEKNLEKELERTLELFKRLKLETQLNKTANDLEELGENQEKLAREEQDQQKQSDINDAFQEIRKDLDEIEKLNQEMKRPEALEDFEELSNDIQEDLDDIQEKLNDESGSQQTPNQKQKNAGAKMKQMASKMNQMQSAMEMEAMQENIEQLQDILDNLVKLSFEEERIFKEIQEIDQTDPRYLTLSQNQLSLMDNSKVIEDSLLALASRVIQISSFITREITSIQEHLKISMDKLKERQKNVAAGHQQFAMASMNNLALLLDNTLQQMQMSMSEAMGNPKKGKGQKPQPKPSDLQQQLGEKIEQLKKSGASGRQLSEQLAKLAAEQAMIRQMLEEEEKKNSELPGKGEDGSSLKEVIEKMEQNETDLVNKRLSQVLISRQKEIATRMLESEKSHREQEESPERESEAARQQSKGYNVAAYEEYLRKRKKEIELLNTIPLELTPFYKKEVNDYFRRLSTTDQ